MIWGLLELYEATFEVSNLQKAVDLNETMLSYFWDNENGGFFFAADSLKELLVRNKEINDGAIPSANSVAALNLLRLGRITANDDWEDKARQIGSAFSQQINRAPSGNTQLMSALTFAFGPSFEVVISGDSNKEDTQAMLKALHKNYSPNKGERRHELGVATWRPVDLL